MPPRRPLPPPESPRQRRNPRRPPMPAPLLKAHQNLDRPVDHQLPQRRTRNRAHARGRQGTDTPHDAHITNTHAVKPRNSTEGQEPQPAWLYRLLKVAIQAMNVQPRCALCLHSVATLTDRYSHGGLWPLRADQPTSITKRKARFPVAGRVSPLGQTIFPRLAPTPPAAPRYSRDPRGARRRRVFRRLGS